MERPRFMLRRFLMNLPSSSLIPPPPPALAGLHLGNLTSAKERTYFPIVVVIAVLIWLLLALTIFGIFYAVIFGVFLWIGHGLLAAHLRSEAVRVSERQWPELHASFLEVCQRLGVAQPPRLYVVQAGGALNAFATRFAGRDFVVLFSDFVEAFEPHAPELKFVLGHELGHLKSGHILKHVMLAPGLFFPLIGPAYRRSWEISCDRHGAFAAQDAQAAQRAMLTLSGGKEKGRTLDAEVFAGQHEDERGFFVSLHELTSHYPTLSRRVRELRALELGTTPPGAPRNPFAYLFAIFIPGGNVGGGAANMLIMVMVIGLMAAMAIPAFQKVRENSIAKACYNNRLQLQMALDQHLLEHGQGPKTWAEIVGPGKIVSAMPACPSRGEYSAKREGNGYEVSCSVHGVGPYAPPTRTR